VPDHPLFNKENHLTTAKLESITQCGRDPGGRCPRRRRHRMSCHRLSFARNHPSRRQTASEFALRDRFKLHPIRLSLATGTGFANSGKSDDETGQRLRGCRVARYRPVFSLFRSDSGCRFKRSLARTRSLTRMSSTVPAFRRLSQSQWSAAASH